MQPYAPDSKYLRTDMGPYPGGVPYLTSEYLQDERIINKNVGRPTNGSIRTSVHTRTRDQNSVNVDQFGFMDTKETLDIVTTMLVDGVNVVAAGLNQGRAPIFLVPYSKCIP